MGLSRTRAHAAVDACSRLKGVGKKALKRFKDRLPVDNELSSLAAADDDEIAGYQDTAERLSGLGSDAKVCTSMLQAGWQHSSPPSREDFATGLTQHFKVPVSPYTACQLPHSRDVYVAGDCEVVSSISAFVLSFVDSTGASAVSWLHQLLKVLTVADRIIPDHSSLDWHVSVDTTESQARPHFIITAGRLSMAFGHCACDPDSIPDAWRGITSFFPAGFNAAFYAAVPYLPLFVAAGNKLQFGILHQASKVEPVGPELDMEDMEDRLCGVMQMVNLYRIVRGLLDLAPGEQEQRVPLGFTTRRSHGATVFLAPDGRQAVKAVPEEYFEAHGTTAAAVQAAHECANACLSLVHNSTCAHFQGMLKVTMTTLGYTRAQLCTEEDKKSAVRCCLRALEHLHLHGLLHCDVRLLNVLWGPEPFLSDLELVHENPWKAPEVRLINWEDARRAADGRVVEGTLDAHGDYTCMSDVYQVGVVLEAMEPSSGAGKKFAKQLKAKRWTAAQAMQQPYMAS